MLQSATSSELPMQGFPHLLGPGLLHDLVLLCKPPPQVLLHELQADQVENTPSTAISTGKTIPLKDPSQSIPFSMPSNLLISYGEAKSSIGLL